MTEPTQIFIAGLLTGLGMLALPTLYTIRRQSAEWRKARSIYRTYRKLVLSMKGIVD